VLSLELLEAPQLAKDGACQNSAGVLLACAVVVVEAAAVVVLLVLMVVELDVEELVQAQVLVELVKDEQTPGSWPSTNWSS
jgi:hypothetical protein